MNSKPRLSWEKIELKLHHPFRLSTGVSTTRTAYWIRLENDEGWGEGTIPPYYNIADADMEAIWEEKSASPVPFPDNLDDIPSWVGDQGPAPARAALDLALFDRIGKIQGVPLYELLKLPPPSGFSTAFTIAIAETDVMAQMALDHPEFPVIKLKLGSEDDISRVAAVRNVRPDVCLYLDANAGWSPEEAIRVIKELKPYCIDMIEQPVQAEDIEGLGYVQAHTDIPIVADESMTSLDRLDQLYRAGVKGINLKIMKLGGLSPTIEILRSARKRGFNIMLGCMAETSLGVSAMAHLASLADWFDLDAPLLIANDPFEGVQYNQAVVSVPNRSGIGVIKNST